jgi:hypothetical protein
LFFKGIIYAKVGFMPFYWLPRGFPILSKPEKYFFSGTKFGKDIGDDLGVMRLGDAQAR